MRIQLHNRLPLVNLRTRRVLNNYLGKANMKSSMSASQPVESSATMNRDENTTQHETEVILASITLAGKEDCIYMQTCRKCCEYFIYKLKDQNPATIISGDSGFKAVSYVWGAVHR